MPEPQYVSTDPNFGTPMRGQPTDARTQATDHPGQYVNELLRNVPADLIEQGKNLATGTYDLLSVLAKATGELGAGTGNFIREAVGLTPNESAGTENLRRLASIPGGMAAHYAQYADPNYRAERVRDEPVGMVLDMLPVSAALKAGGPVVADAAQRGVRAAAHAPGRVIDMAIGAATGRPGAALRGAAGHGPVSSASRALSAISGADTPPSAPAPVAKPVRPRAKPSAEPKAPTPTPGSPATALPRALSPQRIQNELGIAARRAKVTLTEPEYTQAAALVRKGTAPAAAVIEIVEARTPAATLATKPGFMSDAEMNAEIKARVGNRSPRR